MLWPLPFFSFALLLLSLLYAPFVFCLFFSVSIYISVSVIMFVRCVLPHFFANKTAYLEVSSAVPLQKLVCTTIQPTELPFGELYDWQGAADFVADYLNFIPLQPPHELVR